MPRLDMVCSVCDEKITRKHDGPVITINSFKFYPSWRLDAGDPPIRKHIVLCEQHVNYMVTAMEEMANERKRLAGIKDDRPGDSA